MIPKCIYIYNTLPILGEYIMEVKIDCIDTKRVKINVNGTIYGLKKYVGRVAIVAVLPREDEQE